MRRWWCCGLRPSRSSSCLRRRRAGSLARAAPWQPDRGHFHHRLLEANFSVRLIFGIYVATSVLLAAIGYAGHRAGIPDYILFAGFVASFGLWLAFVSVAPRLGARLPDRFRRDRCELIC